MSRARMLSGLKASNVGEATLEQLDADVRRIATDYVHVPPLPMFAEMLRVRNRIYWLLAGRQKPAATAPPASAGRDAVRPAGQRQHRPGLPGRGCGAGPCGLGVRGHHRPQRAAGLDPWHAGADRVLVGTASACGPAGAKRRAFRRFGHGARVRLHSIEARAWSLLGDAREASRCMGAAADARGISGRNRRIA